MSAAVALERDERRRRPDLRRYPKRPATVAELLDQFRGDEQAQVLVLEVWRLARADGRTPAHVAECYDARLIRATGWPERTFYRVKARVRERWEEGRASVFIHNQRHSAHRGWRATRWYLFPADFDDVDPPPAAPPPANDGSCTDLLNPPEGSAPCGRAPPQGVAAADAADCESQTGAEREPGPAESPPEASGPGNPVAWLTAEIRSSLQANGEAAKTGAALGERIGEAAAALVARGEPAFLVEVVARRLIHELCADDAATEHELRRGVRRALARHTDGGAEP